MIFFIKTTVTQRFRILVKVCVDELSFFKNLIEKKNGITFLGKSEKNSELLCLSYNRIYVLWLKFI